MNQKQIGRYIAEKRITQGLTQKNLAEKLFVSDKAVSKWERGICLPGIELVPELSEILGVSIKELLSGEDESAPLDGDNVGGVVINAVNLYTKVKRDHKKKIAIGAGIIILILAIVIIPIYAKYNSSRYNEHALDAWMAAHTSVSDVLHKAADIAKNDYRVDIRTCYELGYMTSDCLSKIGEFSGKTHEGETVYSLSEEAWLSISRNVDSIAFNAFLFFEKNSSEDYYICSPDEIEGLRIMFDSLPRIHDQINDEMGVHSPGISHIYGPWSLIGESNDESSSN